MVREKPERNAELMRRHLEGDTGYELAERYGISVARVNQIIAAYRCKMPLRERQELISEMSAQLDRMRLTAESVMESRPVAALTSKGDFIPVIGPDGKPTGEVAADVSARLDAIRALTTVQARQARLLGLDAPTQTKVDGSVSVHIEGMQDV